MGEEKRDEGLGPARCVLRGPPRFELQFPEGSGGNRSVYVISA